MASKYESVAKLVRIRQGRKTITFEHIGEEILIEYSTQKQSRPVRFTLRKPAVNVLKELLGVSPLRGPMAIGSDDGPGERPPGSVPPEGNPEGKPAGEQAGPKGLKRQADGVVEGMG